MANINLLPWREELRKQRNQEFGTIAVGVLIFAAAIVYFWSASVDKQIEDQRARNKYVEQEISALDEKIKEIKDLKKRREELIERMQIIQDLQGNRPIIVHLFDELARTLPDGVTYTRVKRTGNTFQIEGIAESNNKVSNLMRNLEASPWFKSPNLSKVVAVEGENGEEGVNRFSLTVLQDKPSEKKEGEANGSE